jgi:hypothetical protein
MGKVAHYMNKALLRTLLASFYMIICCFPLEGMFLKKAAQTARTRNIIARPTATAAQKRTVFTHHKLKGLHKDLTKEAQKVSPVLGGGNYAAARTQNMLNTEKNSTIPTINLIHELIDPHNRRPTVNKSKAAYALSPYMIGIILGALETNQLKNPEVLAYIIAQLRHEFKSLTDEKRPLSEPKINKLLDLIIKAYAYDANSTRGILLGVLYAKAQPDDLDDMLLYLLGLEKYMTIFISKDSPTARKLEDYKKRKNIAQQSTETTTGFFARVASAAAAIKKSIQAYFQPKSNPIFTQAEYTSTLENLERMPYHKAEQEGLVNFETTIATFINRRQTLSPYPPKVIVSAYGYLGQPPEPTCGETGMQDLFNIMLYDQRLNRFDFSLLPATIHPHEDFKKFYEQYDIDTVNSPHRNRAFMDMVSGIESIIEAKGYVHKNYELKATSTEANILALLNHFLGISAQNLGELGKMLSDDRREIVFKRTFMSDPVKLPNGGSIIINIKDNKTMQTLKAFFEFIPTIAKFKVPARERHENILSLLENADPESYMVNPEVKALFDIQPNVKILEAMGNEIPSSLLYSIPINEENDKVYAIRTVIEKTTKDKEALEYACSLYNQLPDELKIKTIEALTQAILQSKHWTSFKDFLAHNLKTVAKAFTFFAKNKKDLTPHIHLISEFCDTLTADNKKIFFAYILDDIANYHPLLYGAVTKMAHYLIAQGIDVVATPDDPTIFTPLCSAVSMGSNALVDLFLSQNPAINIVHYNTTALSLAVQGSFSSIIEKLLQKGADPNVGCPRKEIKLKKSYPIFDSLSELRRPTSSAEEAIECTRIIKQLIQYGANVNSVALLEDSFQLLREITPLDYLLDYVELSSKPFSVEKKSEINKLIKILQKSGAKHYSDLAITQKQKLTAEQKQTLTE